MPDEANAARRGADAGPNAIDSRPRRATKLPARFVQSQSPDEPDEEPAPPAKRTRVGGDGALNDGADGSPDGDGDGPNRGFDDGADGAPDGDGDGPNGGASDGDGVGPDVGLNDGVGGLNDGADGEPDHGRGRGARQQRCQRCAGCQAAECGVCKPCVAAKENGARRKLCLARQCAEIMAASDARKRLKYAADGGARAAQMRLKRAADGGAYASSEAERRRMARRAAPKPVDPFGMLKALYDNSAAPASANSRRFARGVESARGDVKRDIDRHVRVAPADTERCRRDYAAFKETPMKVCGTCGIRDPDCKYEEKDLTDLDPSHWAVVPPAVYNRLTAEPDLIMLKPRDDGGFDQVNLPRAEFHHIFESGGRQYHAVKEAVATSSRDENNKAKGAFVDVCAHCRRRWDRLREPPEEPNEAVFDDLYTPAAPASSFAHGDDYGRQQHLATAGIDAPSALEQLVLADARCVLSKP